MRTLAIATSKSLNRKTGTAAVTYVAQQSCPSSCPFQGHGCYAEGGAIGIHTRRLNRAARDATPAEVAMAEAEAIDRCEVRFEGQPMRLHSVGDCASNLAARIVARACARWQERGGGPVWTYTHAWREVDRDAWGTVSVLASCETFAEVIEARARGYAAAIVVEEFGPGMVACPAQTHHTSCTDCRLCMDDAGLRRRRKVIGFKVHGDASTILSASATLRGTKRPKLREVIPAMVEKSDVQIAELTGTNKSSVWEMRKRLRAEGVIA